MNWNFSPTSASGDRADLTMLSVSSGTLFGTVPDNFCK